MIKISELRIGNLIMEDGEVTKVYMLGNHVNESINDMGMLSDRFTPIPLTNTWVNKFGYYTEVNNPGTDVESIPFYSNDSHLTLDWNTLEPSWQGIELEIKLEYVHQLQNL